MPGASPGLLDFIRESQRRRRLAEGGDLGLPSEDQDLSYLRSGTMEPAFTTPRQMTDRYQASQHAENPSELSARYAQGEDEEKPFFISHPFTAGMLAGLGGGGEGIRTLAKVREDYRRMKERELDRKMEEDRRRETMRMEEARHRESLGVQLGAPSLAGDQGVAGAIEAKRQREEQLRQDTIARQDAQRQETLNKPMTVSPEQGVWDPKARQWIVPPRFRPTREPAGRANQERDDAEKAMGTITKLRNQSIDWNAEMEGIRVKAEKARGKGKMPWDEEAPDPKTGYGSGLTYRQRYQMLKRKNDAAVSEINRLQGKVGSLTGRGGQAPQKAPATAGGSATAPSGALASALEKEARGDPVTSLTPEERKAIIAYKEQQSAVQPGAASGG